MKSVNTFCRICEPQCPLIADVEGDQVVKLHPNRDHPVYQGFCCHKGLTLNEVHHDPDRLNRPLRRVNPRDEFPAQFEPVSWDVAIAEIAAKLAVARAQSANAIGIYRGNPLGLNSALLRTLSKFVGKIGTRMYFSPATQDCANKMAGAKALYGGEMIHPQPDFEHTKYLLCIGGNPKISHMSFVHTANAIGRMRDIVGRGGSVVYVNPRRIESATPATGEILLIKPDTDLYLLAALLNEIYHTVGFAEEAIRRHSVNRDGLVGFIERYPVERVAPIVGVPADVLRKMAGDFAHAEGASIYMSTGVNMGRQGTLAYWLVQMLSLVTGNLGRRGGNIMARGYLPPVNLGIGGGADPYFETALGPQKHVAGALPGNLLADYLAADEDPIRALLVICGNPILSIAGEERTRSALGRLDLVVCIDLYRSATTEHADFILPGVDMLERRDVNLLNNGCQTHPFAQYTDAVVPPAGDRREEWWILSRLEQAMGLPSVLDTPGADPFDEIDQMLGTSGLSIAGLKASPHNTAVMPPNDPADTFELLGAETRPIDCCPAEFTGALTRAEEIFEELRQEPPGQLKLITLRTNYMHNSWMANVRKLKRGVHVSNPLMMSPQDAVSQGLSDGDAVRVSNAYGQIEARVLIDDSLRDGVVAMSHGWGNSRTPGMSVAFENPGVNVNKLMPTGPGSFETLSNQAFLTGVPVTVTPMVRDLEGRPRPM